MEEMNSVNNAKRLFHLAQMEFDFEDIILNTDDVVASQHLKFLKPSRMIIFMTTILSKVKISTMNTIWY